MGQFKELMAEVQEQCNWDLEESDSYDTWKVFQIAEVALKVKSYFDQDTDLVRVLLELWASAEEGLTIIEEEGDQETEELDFVEGES